LATEASQRLLEKLAGEALAEIEVGHARLMWSPGFGQAPMTSTIGF